METSTIPDFWAWLDGVSTPPQPEPKPDPVKPINHVHTITGSGRRKYPNIKTRQAVLRQQRDRCLYCGHMFGTTVRRKRGGTVALRINWDHFVPYAYGHTNAGANWVAACHVCNNIKSCRMFDTVREAQTYVRARWSEKGYELLAALLPVTIEEPAPAEPERNSLDMTPADMRAAWDAYDEELGKPTSSFQAAAEAAFLAAFKAGIRAAADAHTPNPAQGN